MVLIPRLNKLRGGQKSVIGFLWQLGHRTFWKWGVKQTALQHYPQGFSVPHSFTKNKRRLPSGSLRPFRFISPWAGTRLHDIGQLMVMKCHEVF